MAWFPESGIIAVREFALAEAQTTAGIWGV